ncbi:MAG TPA: ABC transporter permease [Chroococcales cyanobacterium]
MNFRIVRALILKYAYICSRNTFRALDVFFWPLMDLLLWGFLTVYMLDVSHSPPTMVTFLIAAIILWNVLWRAQQVISTSFLDDVWSRNLLNIFCAPIRTREYVGAAFIMGLAQSLLVTVLLSVLAMLFYKFSLLALGVSLGVLFANLVLMGWSIGLLTTSFVLRWGPPAEALAWAVPVLLQPISAVFYPVKVLPVWMQALAWCTPSAHVFEGMREILSTGHVDANRIWCAFLLNIALMAFSAYVFHSFLESARVKGFLAKYGA